MIKGLLFFMKFGWINEKKYIIYTILNQIINSITPIVNVVLPKYIIDELLHYQRLQYLIVYIAVLLGYNFIAKCIVSWLSLKGFTLRCKVSAAFGKYMHKRLAVADFSNLESPSFLDLKEKANKFLYGDWHGFSYLLDNALGIVGQIITLIGIITIIASLDVRIIIVFMILVFIEAAVDSFAQKKGIAYSMQSVSAERRWNYFGSLFEDFRYGKEIRINNIGEWLLDQEQEYAQKAIKFYEKRNSSYIRSGFSSSLINMIELSIAYIYLISASIKNLISIGDFTMYIGAITTFSDTLRSITKNVTEIYAYGIYYQALEDYINIPMLLRNNKHLQLKKEFKEIEFRNVSFKYPSQDEYALKNINLKIKVGDRISIVGENGAGKTTFIKLLTRMYDPSEGEILIDGQNIKDIDYDEYMSLFAAIFQDHMLFSLSLKDNIALSNINVTDEQVYDALKKVGLDAKINSLKDGINTYVYRDFNENGFTPSGGETQKIAMARALCKNSPVIILDEPTAALDPRAEYEMYKNFDEIVQNKTAIYISHRMSITRFCDNIVVFSHGEIKEFGNHDSLMKQNGKYTELFKMQSQFYI